MSVIRRIRYVLPRKEKLLVFNSLVKPHFHYCSTLLFYANARTYENIQVLINKGLRAILNVPMDTRVSYMLKELKMLPIQDFVYVETMVFIYRIANGLTPEYLSEKIRTLKTIHNYNTRGKDNISITEPIQRISLFYEGFSKYNQIDKNIKKLQCVKQFREQLIKTVN